MKSAQWTAVLVLGLMVGGLTFLMVYHGGVNPPRTLDITEVPTLNFAHKKLPLDGYPAPTSEVNQEGHQDFWFENTTGEKLTVGLHDKGCQCSHVSIAIAPDNWRQRLANEAGFRLLQRALCRLEDLPTLAATYQHERIFPEVSEGEAAKVVKLDLENSIEVPEGAVGWVRLSWMRSQAVPLRTHAGLWMGQRGDTNARLQVDVKIAEPMEVNKDVEARPVDYRDLAKGKIVWIDCWSVTRRKFTVKPQLLREYGTAESDPFEVGKPVPMPAERMRFMEQKMRELEGLRILAGYRVPLIIKDKAKDGTPIDWGNFRRYVRIACEDASMEPAQVRIIGEIRGDVMVGGLKEAGGINLGPFPTSRGTHGEVLLQSDEADVDLELDKTRIPKFMQVKFDGKAEKAPTGLLMWKLQVKIPANVARGEFPRPDDPVYRDSAIYVKTKPKNKESLPHTIRVPVYGTANEG